MTENDNSRPVVVQFLQLLGDGPHRNQPCAFDVANGVLLRFPYIDQTERNTISQKAVHFPRGNLNWQQIHRTRV